MKATEQLEHARVDEEKYYSPPDMPQRTAPKGWIQVALPKEKGADKILKQIAEDANKNAKNSISQRYTWKIR